MEYSEELCPGGYRFFYQDGLFRPGTDSFLLSAFPRLRPGLRVCDLGSGTGLLGLLLMQRQDLSVTGVELQMEAVRLAERAAAANGLTDRMRTVPGDLRNIRALLPAGAFDLVVCTPPYYPPGSGAVSPDDARRTARTESACTLADICRAAAYLLRWGGSVCLVHKPERLTDLLCLLREHALEPKRLRFVEACAGAAPSLVLIEGRRGGRPGLAAERPLILQNPDGSPTAELDAVYFRTSCATEDLP